MIIEAIMDALKSLILFVIGLLPAGPDLSFVTDWMQPFVAVLRSVNQFLHLPTIAVCLLAIFVCYNARLIWSIVMWVVRKIPGVS